MSSVLLFKILAGPHNESNTNTHIHTPYLTQASVALGLVIVYLVSTNSFIKTCFAQHICSFLTNSTVQHVQASMFWPLSCSTIDNGG